MRRVHFTQGHFKDPYRLTQKVVIYLYSSVQHNFGHLIRLTQVSYVPKVNVCRCVFLTTFSFLDKLSKGNYYLYWVTLVVVTRTMFGPIEQRDVDGLLFVVVIVRVLATQKVGRFYRLVFMVKGNKVTFYRVRGKKGVTI